MIITTKQKNLAILDINSELKGKSQQTKELLQPDNRYLEKPTANIILSSKILNAFPLKLGRR